MLKILCNGTGILRIRDQKKGLTERVPTFDADQAQLLATVQDFMDRYQLKGIVVWTDQYYRVERLGSFDLLAGVGMTRWERVVAWWRRFK